MSTTQTPAPAPTIQRPGTKPTTPRKLFVNVPITDVQRTIDFFEGLGFTFNAQFTDANATSMLVGEDAYFMFLKREFFATFTTAPVGDPRKDTTGIYALGVDDRASVDAMVHRAEELGGKAYGEPKDHGFMYQWAFHDLDGHHWEVFWMDPSAVQG